MMPCTLNSPYGRDVRLQPWIDSNWASQEPSTLNACEGRAQGRAAGATRQIDRHRAPRENPTSAYSFGREERFTRLSLHALENAPCASPDSPQTTLCAEPGPDLEEIF